jgi:uncharacterized protein (DUF433 family)
MSELVGLGIYSQPEAAYLLKMRPTRLRRWVNGYTYRLNQEASEVLRDRPPVLHKSAIPTIGGTVALSFLELMELRVLKLLVDQYKIPLQTVRRLAQEAQRTLQTRYPFATRRVFAEERRVFASISGDESDADVIELGRGSRIQIQWAKMFEPVLREVEFDPETSFAERWWPCAPERWVVLDPEVMFGAPVISGSRLRTSAVVRMAKNYGESATAVAYRVAEEGIRAALRFENYLAAAA